MKLIIDIPDKMYEEVKSGIWFENNIISNAIDKGTPLSESEDCVSRQAVLEAIEDNNRNAHYSCFASNNDAQSFKQIIRELPPVKPQPKMGRWVYNKNLSTHYGDVYTCSECGERCLESCYDHIDKLPDFCPKCHTKMEVE